MKLLQSIKNFFSSIGTWQGIVSIILVVIVCAVLIKFRKNKGKGLSTRDVVAIGVGAALYAGLSAFQIPIGPNTSLRIAIALLVIFGAIFGPGVGFLVGFIGHALNDAFTYGSVWWSWVFLSAVVGLFAGLVTLDKDFDVLSGKINKIHYIKLYVYSIVSLVVGSIIAYIGDVFLYSEPAGKVWLQIILAGLSNLAIVAVIGIPVVIALANINSRNRNLEIND